MTAYYAELLDRYPLVSIEDPLAEDDRAGWQQLTAELGDRVQLVGDDLFVTNPARPARRHRAGRRQLAAREGEPDRHPDRDPDAVQPAQRSGYTAIPAPTSGETEDVTIADLAVATDCGQIKTGAPARSERVGYNQLLRIEEELAAAARYAGRSAFPRFAAK